MQWTGTDVGALAPGRLGYPCILKSTHASGHVFVARAAADFDLAALVPMTAAWLSYCHGSHTGEPAYLPVPRRLILENLLQMPDGTPPPEMKLFLFNGRVEVLQPILHQPDGTRETGFFDRDWRALGWLSNSRPLTAPLARPRQFAALVESAEILGAGFDHLRIDFYDCDDRIYIGEITVYSWSGLGGLMPAAADAAMGRYWQLDRPLRRAVRAVLFTSWGLWHDSAA